MTEQQVRNIHGMMVKGMKWQEIATRLDCDVSTISHIWVGRNYKRWRMSQADRKIVQGHMEKRKAQNQYTGPYDG